MKSFSFASFLLAMAFIMNIAFYFQIKDTTSDLDTQLNSIINLTQSREIKKANEEFIKLKNKVHKNKNIWMFVINHKELDNIETTLQSIEGYFKNEKKDDIVANLYSLKFYIENIYLREKVTFTNVF